MPYMVTFTINIPQMLAYLAYDWILWVLVYESPLNRPFSIALYEANIHRARGEAPLLCLSRRLFRSEAILELVDMIDIVCIYIYNTCIHTYLYVCIILWLYIYIYIYIHCMSYVYVCIFNIYMYTVHILHKWFIYVRTFVRMYACMHACMYVCMCMYIYIYTYTYIYICIYIYRYIMIYIYTYIHLWMYVYVYIYIYTLYVICICVYI